jgi:hypothetical protein
MTAGGAGVSPEAAHPSEAIRKVPISNMKLEFLREDLAERLIMQLILSPFSIHNHTLPS